MTDTQPCGQCGSPVEVQSRTAPVRLGDAPQPTEIRVCTNPECPTRLGAHRLGEPDDA
jgi:hypothetical protein